MIGFRHLGAVALAGLLALAPAVNALGEESLPVPNPAIADMSVDQLIAARKAAMREDGQILRGASSLSGEDAVNAATRLLVNFTDFHALFREGSGTGDTHALPAIWEDWATFSDILTRGQVAASAALVAANAGDDAGFKAALQPLGGLCGECHQQFRGR